jgi:hypothetical protein
MGIYQIGEWVLPSLYCWWSRAIDALHRRRLQLGPPEAMHAYRTINRMPSEAGRGSARRRSRFDRGLDGLGDLPDVRVPRMPQYTSAKALVAALHSITLLTLQHELVEIHDQGTTAPAIGQRR